VIWWMLAQAVAMECTAVSVTDLSRGRVQAEAAIEQVDPDKLLMVGEALRHDVACVTDVLMPQDVAGLFRIRGFVAFVEQDRDTATEWFRAARSVDPGYDLPPLLAAPRHPLRRLYDAAEPRQGDVTRSLPMVRDGELWVDGEVASSAPSERPFLLQHVSAEGEVLLTEVVPAGGELPARLMAAGGGGDQAPATLIVLGAWQQVAPTTVGATGFGGVVVGGQLPVWRRVVAQARAGIGWSPVRDGWAVDDDVALVWSPSMSVGGAVDVPVGAGFVRPGADLLGALGPGVDGGVAVRAGAGGSLAGGVALGGVALVLEGRGGWAGGPMAQVGLGVEVGR